RHVNCRPGRESPAAVQDCRLRDDGPRKTPCAVAGSKPRPRRGFRPARGRGGRRASKGTGLARPPAMTISRSWLWRAPLLLWLGWTGWRYLADPDYWSIFSGVIFGAHEFGHVFFAPFGEFMTVAGGSLMQVLVPLGAVGLLAARRDWCGTAVAGCWLSFVVLAASFTWGLWTCLRPAPEPVAPAPASV
ncbi:MAG TPA: hypothetical protein VI297_06215, partial [Gemmatimonadales bacterium]